MKCSDYLPRKITALVRSLVCGALVLASLAVPISRASAQNATNADAVFNGWLQAYLIRSGGKTYFCNTLSDRSMAFLWGQAYMITAVEDAYDRSPTSANRQLITDLLTTFEQQNGTDLSWDGWNDDVEWCAIILIRGYQITGNTSYRDAAAQAWNMVYNRGYSTVYGGGIWERMDDATVGDKGGLSNWPQIIAGCMLYQATYDSTYLTKCESLYDWTRANCYDPNSGRVYEAYSQRSGGMHGDDNSYNSGLLVNAANALYKPTGNSLYYNDAVKAADHCVAKYNGTNGIMTEDHPSNGSFGCDQFVRGLSKFARENNLWSKYYSFLQNNCTAAWNNRRTDYNITENNFNTPTSSAAPSPSGGDTFAAMEMEGSVVIQMVTQINTLMGAHTIINQQNGEAVDNGNSAGSTSSQNAGLILYGSNRGPDQWWNFTQNSDNSWNIISVRSGQAFDNASSTANGTQVIQYFSNSDNTNQRWWVDVQSDGTYKIWNKSNSKSLDNGSKSGNNIPLLQWDWNGGTQQRWKLQ